MSTENSAENVATKIAQTKLSDYGIEVEKPKPASKTTSPASSFDIPTFLDRRKTKPVSSNMPIKGGKLDITPGFGTKEPIRDRLRELASKRASHRIEREDFDETVELLARDMLDMMECAGFIVAHHTAGETLRQAVSSFIVHQMMLNNDKVEIV